MAAMIEDEGTDVDPVEDHYNIDAAGIANAATNRYTAYVRDHPDFTIEQMVKAYTDFSRAVSGLEAAAGQENAQLSNLLRLQMSAIRRPQFIRARTARTLTTHWPDGERKFTVPPFSKQEPHLHLTPVMSFVAATVFGRVEPLWRGYDNDSFPEGLDMDFSRHWEHNTHIIEADGMLPTIKAVIKLINKHFPWMDPTIETVVPDNEFSRRGTDGPPDDAVMYDEALHSDEAGPFPERPFSAVYNGPRSWRQLTITGAFVDMACA